MPIHPTAIVDKRAEIDPTAEIGPYAVIDGFVRIGPGTRVFAHAHIDGWTEIGADCQIHPFAAVGHFPQDLAFTGDESYTRIGDGTIIREGATIHRGTTPGSATVVGRNCFLMTGSHIAHNCVVGDDVKLANGAALGGHVHVGNGAFISGHCVVHQFVRIGELVMMQGLTGASMDVPPFVMTAGINISAGINIVGLRRAGFSAEERDEIRAAYRTLYRSRLSFREAIERVAETVRTAPGQRLAEFLKAPTKRGYVSRPHRKPLGESTDI